MSEQTAEDQAFRAELHNWLAENLTDEFSLKRENNYEENFAIRRAWQKRLAEGRWIGIDWPYEYGGRSATLNQQIIYIEEMARVKAPETANRVGVGIVGPTVLSVGTAEQKARYLPGILSADVMWCQGFSEPNSGSDVASLTTSAVLDGDEFVINGQKVWTSLGFAADYCILLCRTNPRVPKHKGLSYIVVDMRSPGVTQKPLVQITADNDFSEVFFDNVRVPASNLMGNMNEGWGMAITTLMHERATAAFGYATIFEREMLDLLNLAHSYKRNGRPAIQDNEIAQRIARCYNDVHLFKLNVVRHISRLTGGTVPGPEGSFFKLQWSEMHQRMAELALDIIGEWSMAGQEEASAPDGGEWHFNLLKARASTIRAGTSEIQRNIIAERVLGLRLLQ